MQYPSLIELNISRDFVDAFGGYNHNLRIGENEFYDMKNLTSTYFPALSPRGKRGTYVNASEPQGMIAKDALCYVDGTDFVINQYHINLGLSTDPKNCPKRLVSMGAYVIIFPDGKWINTAKWDGTTFNATDEAGNIDGYGDIDRTFTTTSDVKFTLTRINGDDYSVEYTQSTEPQSDSIQNGSLWLDQSTTPHTLKQYSATSGMWVAVATTYIKIESPGIGVGFEQYDGVTISGLKGVELKSSVLDDDGSNIILQGNSASQISEIDGSMVIWERDDDYIVVVGVLDTAQSIINEVTVSRKMPVMDFVTESENRLWGCRYGTSNNGDVVNEIYACKLGDFKNWNCFMGLSTDSYAASCGTDGQFTGAITHLGYPLFFKENFLHKVYGNYPANYQIQTTACRGVQRGCSNSLAIVNEVLYYKARSGICAYDGSLPMEISTALGEVSYSDAVAGVIGNKYYVSMKDTTEEWCLFVYDVSKGTWHREDYVQADFFCACRGELYYIDHDTKTIKTINGSGTLDSKAVEWMAETGPLGTSSPDRKYISRLTVRLSLAVGSRVSFYAQYDSSGEWEQLCTLTGTSLKTFAVPIRAKRCDHMRLRIEGEGEAKIFSIAKTIEEGSDGSDRY